MFARSVRYNLRAGSRSTFETYVNELAPLYRGQPGFCSLTTMVEGPLAEFVVLSIWETKEDAEAAGAVRPESLQWLDRALLGPPVVRIYEVFEPHG
jgi:heme-degrading monooxygenase HmoA